MLQKLLEYQNLERKLINLKRELETHISKVTLNKVIIMVKDEQNKLLALDEKAKNLMQEYEKSKKEYEETFESISNLSKLNTDSLTEEEISKNIESLNKFTSSLGFLERTLSSQQGVVSKIIESFETCKNNIVILKQKYKDSKISYDKVESTIRPQCEEIKKQMQEMEKHLDKTMLSKYKQLRQDKIFPIFVPLNQSACGGCSMALPKALIDKLKQDGYLECEQCKRYIYIS